MKAFALIFCALLAGCASQPQEPRYMTFGDGHKRDLIRVVEANTPYRGFDMPVVRILSSSEMRQVSRAAGAAETVSAGYFCETRTLVVGDELKDYPAPIEISTIIHELTHHAQCLAGHNMTGNRCPLEKEAYNVQRAYLLSAREKAFGSSLAAIDLFLGHFDKFEAHSCALPDPTTRR